MNHHKKHTEVSEVGTNLFEEKTLGELLAEGFEEFADALQSDKRAAAEEFTCHKISLELQPTAYDPTLVRETRQLLKASQSVFAKFLGVSVKTVRAWEQGNNVPRDATCRLMDEIRHNPKYFQKRMSELAVRKSPRPKKIKG